MKKLIATLIIIATFMGGFLFGQHNTITHASLHSITADGYQLNFNGQIHDYE
jgi:hypothetical protein